jgi:hypothetical protein
MNALTGFLLRHKIMVTVVVGTIFILATSLVAMQFTDGVSWSAFDFALMSVFLIGFGFILERATAVFRSSTHKAAIGAAVVVVAAVLFVELSVGLVGSPLAGS